MVQKKAAHKSRQKKSYVQDRQAKKLKDRGKIQVYLSGDHRKLIQQAIDIQEHGNLSSFCSQAAYREAKRIVADHEQTLDPVTV